MNDEYQVLVREVPNSWWSVQVISHKRELINRIPHDIYVVHSEVVYEQDGIVDKETAYSIGDNFIRKQID